MFLTRRSQEGPCICALFLTEERWKLLQHVSPGKGYSYCKSQAKIKKINEIKIFKTHC